MPTAAYTARTNPFRTQRILTVRYRPLDTDWDALLERLRGLNNRAAIVGPQGAGKTTLLEDLAARLEADGTTTRWLQLRRDTRTEAAAQVRSFLASAAAGDFLLVDGAEQLGPMTWRRLRGSSRSGRSLVISTHMPGRLPTLIDCRTTPALLESIVEELVPEDVAVLSPDLPALFTRHQGNLRLCLRELYDRYATSPTS